MSCQNCYNGCTDIISDKCTKYTGNNVPELGIENGDSLFSVQQSIFSFLLSVIDGTSIKPEINQDYICEKISQYLGEQELTLSNIINVILQTTCDLQTQVTNVKNSVDTINTAYTLNCVSGVTDNTNTHEVLQAVITKLCNVNTALTALSLNVSTNYVKLSELNNLIAAYLSGGSTSIKLYNKMIPYTVVEFYGNLSGKFDSTGAGLGDWEKIYLCNGNNGTPDKRGRVSVGTTTGMGGGTLDSAVDPSVSGNPIYSSTYFFSSSLKYSKTFSFKKLVPFTIFSHAMIFSSSFIPALYLSFIISAIDFAIIFKTLGPTAIVIKLTCSPTSLIFALSFDIIPLTFFTVSITACSPTTSTSYSWSIFSWSITLSFTSAKTTSYPASDIIFPINPRPIFPAPKCNAFFISASSISNTRKYN